LSLYSRADWADARAAWLVWVEYWRAASRDEQLRRESQDLYDRHRALIVDVLEEGKASHLFNFSLASELVAGQLIALIDGIGVPLVLEHNQLRVKAEAITLVAVAVLVGCSDPVFEKCSVRRPTEKETT
jgi:hypothetical protein